MKQIKKTATHGTKITSETTAVAGHAAPEVAPAPPVTTVAASAPALLDARVAQATTFFQEGIAVLDLNAPALSALERKRLGKLRRGGEKLMPLLAQLSGKWGLEVRTQPTADMTRAAATVTTLQPVITLLQGLLQELQDASAVANSQAWSTASVLYALLKRMSRKDPKLAAQLAPASEFFAARRAAPKGATVNKTDRKKAKAVAKAEALVAEQPVTAPPATHAPVPETGTSTPHA